MPVPTLPLVPGRPAWCFHINRDKIKDYRGRPCHFGWLFDCEVHQECFLVPQKDAPGVTNCATCANYEPE